jgi:hypothetical protein
VCLEARRNPLNRIARQLRPKPREALSQRVICQPMQLDPIGTTVLVGYRRHPIASRGKRHLHCGKLLSLTASRHESNCNRSFHYLHSTRQVCHTLGTLQEQRLFRGVNAGVIALIRR